MIGAESTVLDPSALRRAFSCFPSGVTAVCGLVDGEPVGMAASSFTSVSLDPPLVLVCVASTSGTWPRLRPLPRLGISVLSAGHDVACRQLAAREGERFTSLDWRATPEGTVLMGGASAWLECEIEQEIDAGDHLIVLFRILTLEADPEVEPLVFHGSRFRPLAVGAP